MPICLYCNREKEEKEFSQEHVLPRGIGGALTPVNPFSVNDVCIRCNTLSGFFIDAPFIKSWFINNHRASNAKKHIKLSINTILPLVYFGEIEELKFEDQICEFWLGPTGDCIYHFHQPYPTNKDTSPLVGIPPTAKRGEIDNGFVFLFVRSNNSEWHPAIFNSVLSNFKKSEFYLGNGPTPKGGAFSDIPESLLNLHNELKNMQGQSHKNRVLIGIDTGERFLAKLALGIGSILLNDSFRQSKSADLLRKFMWTKDIDERRKIPIHGTSFIVNNEGMKNINEFLKWNGGHVIMAMNIKGSLVLYTNLYEENSAVIQISDEPEHWTGRINEGVCYIIVPGLQKSVGPISLTELIAHKHEPTYTNDELQELETLMSKFDQLPPFDVDDSEK